jgi:hypothetical protein
MTEKQIFLKAWEREYETNLAVLGAIPTDILDLKPTERSRSPKEIAWTIVAEERELIGGGVAGIVNLKPGPKAPSTLPEIISSYKRIHEETLERVKASSDADFEKPVKGFAPTKKLGDPRRADALWSALIDTVQNRGQLSAYLNMVGATSPSGTYIPIQFEK